MENEISNQYIENAIHELETSFGIKEPISGEEIFSLLRSGNMKESTKAIARQLGLPIDINIVKVPNDYKAQSNDTQFHSTHLAKVSQHGSEGITAQVSIPSSLPFYGSKDLESYVINVRISENCAEYPVVFVMVMTHELSHILLHSLNHRQKDNEFYTDLTAIILGFQTIFQNGRKITTTEEESDFMTTTIKTSTTTYGYLSDEQFIFASDEISGILAKKRINKNLLSDELMKFKKLLLKYTKTFFRFKKFIEYHSKKPSQKISKEDSKKIMTFFYPGYIDDLEIYLKRHKQNDEKIGQFFRALSHYTDQKMSQLSIYIDQIQSSAKELKNQLDTLRGDEKILKRYASLFYRIKVFCLYLFK